MRSEFAGEREQKSLWSAVIVGVGPFGFLTNGKRETYVDSSMRIAFTNSDETIDVEMCQAGEALNVAVTSIDLSCHTVPSDVIGCEAEGIA